MCVGSVVSGPDYWVSVVVVTLLPSMAVGAKKTVSERERENWFPISEI